LTYSQQNVYDYKEVRISLICLFLLTSSAWAGTSALEGIVKDASGRPIKGAEIRVDSKDGSKFSKMIKTDANGHYISNGLVVGAYKVTLIVNGSVKASILNATTRSGKPTQLNFDLGQTKGAPKRHMVWVPGETGTLIGGGRWIDVDENGNVVNDSINVQTLNANAARQMLIKAVPGNPGGH